MTYEWIESVAGGIIAMIIAARWARTHRAAIRAWIYAPRRQEGS